MKVTALIATTALLFGTAAFAQQDQSTTRGEESTQHQDHGTAGAKLRNGMHNLGDKTRHAMHRMDEKLHAKRDHADNTRAMGARSESTVADNSSERQHRMDDAYTNWQSKHEKTDNR